MTHFIGAVLIPTAAQFPKIAPAPDEFPGISTKSTEWPDLYGWDALDHTASPALQRYLNLALAKFDEGKEVEYWVSREETIAAARKKIEEYRDGTYAEYISDPETYAAGVTNEHHLRYLADEFPKRLKWTDDEVYAHAIQGEDPENIAVNGDVRHTYNPDSQWDWWTIGGRWEKIYRERQTETLAAWQEQLKAKIADMLDPEALAEMAAFDADAKAQMEALKAAGGSGKALWDLQDKLSEKRVELRAYSPWWVPYSFVVPTLPEGTDFEWLTKGQMGWWGMTDDNMTDVAWLQAMLAATENYDPDSRLVYIDFHI